MNVHLEKSMAGWGQSSRCRSLSQCSSFGSTTMTWRSRISSYSSAKASTKLQLSLLAPHQNPKEMMIANRLPVGLRMQLRHNFVLNNVNVKPRSTQTFKFSLFKMVEEIRNVDFRSTAIKDPPKSSQRHIKLISKACLKHSSNSSSAHINFQFTIRNQVKVNSKSSWIQNQTWIHRNSMWAISIPVSELCSFQCHNISQHTTTYHIPWYCATSK